MIKQETRRFQENPLESITLFKMGVGTLQNFRLILEQMDTLGDQFKLEQAAHVSIIALATIKRSGISIFDLLPPGINFATLFEFGDDKVIRIHREKDGKKVADKPTRKNSWDFFNQVLPHVQAKHPEYIDTL